MHTSGTQCPIEVLLAQSGIPSDVERFVTTFVDSVTQLEVLLLLRRSTPREWTPAQVASELRIDVTQATDHLTDFLHDSLIDTAPHPREAAYRFRGGGEFDGTISELDRVYRERSVALITLIFSKPSQHLQLFADAFKLGKGK